MMADNKGNDGGGHRPPPINTSRIMTQRSYAAVASSNTTSNTTSNATGSSGDASSSKRFTPATPLYSDSIWTPGPIPGATQSAAMPPKPVWELITQHQAQVSSNLIS